jgi:steroid 5-alpha reductase family enzyme
LSATLAVLTDTLALTLIVMLVLWLLSLAIKDASIVDIFWGIGFTLIALACFLISQGYQSRKLLVLALTAVWGLRLALHIFTRNRGKGEDFRYRRMRKHYGARFPLVSLFTVFGFQGLLMWIISLPLQVAEISPLPARLTWLDYLGAAIWAIGLFFEAVGDWQLARFKSDPANQGRVMDRGLWTYTRHPNYFGDALLWWGLCVIALATPGAIWTVISPLIMTTLLMRVSGVALLEKTLVKTKPEYEEYVRRTNAFVPWLPKGWPGGF